MQACNTVVNYEMQPVNPGSQKISCSRFVLAFNYRDDSLIVSLHKKHTLVFSVQTIRGFFLVEKKKRCIKKDKAMRCVAMRVKGLAGSVERSGIKQRSFLFPLATKLLTCKCQFLPGALFLLSLHLPLWRESPESDFALIFLPEYISSSSSNSKPVVHLVLTHVFFFSWL